VKNGNKTGRPIFTKKNFWPKFFWLFVLCAGGAFSCIFNSAPLFTASLLAAFLGLTESGRWSHKTNMLVCIAAAVIGSVACGVFTLFETVSVFVLLFVVGGFMLYYKDSTLRLIPEMEEFADEVSKERDINSIVSSALEKIKDMAAGDEVFIAVSSDKGSELYMPGVSGGARIDVPRNGGAVWKVFASGRPYMTGRVEPSKDMPFDRDACSLMSVILSTKGDKLGVLQIESRTQNAFSEDDLARLGMLAFILSQILYGVIINDSD